MYLVDQISSEQSINENDCFLSNLSIKSVFKTFHQLSWEYFPYFISHYFAIPFKIK